MKRWLGVLALVLLLSGCGNQKAQTPSGSNATAPTKPEPGLYIEESNLEKQTGGAVRVHDLEGRGCVRLAVMGDHHLLFGEDSLTLLKGEYLTPSVTVQIPGVQECAVSIQTEGVAYQEKETGSVVFLNSHLRKSGTLQLPQGTVGDIYIASDWKQIYYCTAQGVAVLDAGTGISRMLLEMEGDWLGISGSFQNESILRCRIRKEDGVRTLMISTQTGTILKEGDYLTGLVGTEERYYLEKQTGETVEYIFGTGKEQPCNFFPTEEGTLFALPEMAGILQQVAADNGVFLHYYDLNSGLRSASVRLPEFQEVSCVGGENGVVWFAADGYLYRWDTAKSPADDPAVYTAYRYTREDPDEEGLQNVGSRLARLEQRYGVKFIYWEDAAGVSPWDYSFDVEYVPEAYEAQLPALEMAMSHFPENFFQKAAQWTDSGKLSIVLVRGIYGGPDPSLYTSVSGIQYNMDRETFLALCMQEGAEQSFYHALGHLVDARVLSTCDAYVNWSDLNPWDFKYDNDYVKNQNRKDTKYLEGQKRYFIDFYSMSFAVEDRSRILEYACMPGNEEVFASKYMQKKLKTVCNGIRAAFDLPDGEYIWEQYLQ